MNKLFSRMMIVLTLVAVLAGALAFGATKARAADGTFNISVYHGINGKALGLSKELPVIASVYSGDQLIAELPLAFKDRFSADLPAGTYTIMVSAVVGGDLIPVPSMTVGPVAIPADVDVRLNARLAEGGTPILSVRVK
jgi:hypothetical protein